MKKKIIVTKQCIKEGEKGSYVNCPIARACNESNIKIHGVLTNKINFTLDSSDSIVLPVSAIRFIERYDDGVLVKPFKFTVEVPEQYISK